MTHSYTCRGHYFVFPRVTEINAQPAPEAISRGESSYAPPASAPSEHVAAPGRPESR